MFINSFEFNLKYTQLQSSEITLKLKNLGINKIFSDEFFDGFKQFEVYINGNIQKETKKEYNLINENEINNIKIIFKENLLSANKMFYNLDSLIEINLSNFDTSYITTMKDMFYGCTTLNSIDVSNINTHSVLDMSSMFSGCASLKSLDLSNFDTSEVTDSSYMFSACFYLNFLNLSNFNLSKVNTIKEMFNQCYSLKYINFKNAKINKTVIDNSQNIFSELCRDLIITLEEDNDALMNINIFSEKKYIYCNNKNSYQEKKYTCYMKNLELTNAYICEIYGQNIYRIYQTNLNDISSALECFELIDFYYIDEKNLNYKQCYYSCKRCEIKGNETNHNCLSCKNDFIEELDKADSNYKNCYQSKIMITMVYEPFYDRIQIIRKLIQDLINGFDISYFDSGKEENRSVDENMIIKLFHLIIKTTIKKKMI